MDPVLIERIFAEAGDAAVEIMPYTGGEPTLGPLEELARLCRRHNAFMTFTTNGLLLGAERFRSIADACGRVVFSFHSHLPEVFARIEPGADHERVVANLRAAIRIAAPYDIQMMTGLVLMDFNIEHLPEWFDFVADLGIRQVGFTSLHPNTPDREAIDVYGNRSPAEIEDLVAGGMEVAGRRGIFVETNVAEAYYTRFPDNRKSRRTRFDILQDMNGISSLFKPGFCPLVANMLTIEHRKSAPSGRASRSG